MEEIKLDFSECLEGLVDIADYLLALHGKEAECNTIDDVEPLTESEELAFGNILSTIELSLTSALDSIINNLLQAKGILKYTDDCDYESLQDAYEIILEKGKRGYFELLKKCHIDHPEFGKIVAQVDKPSDKSKYNIGTIHNNGKIEMH